MVTTSVSPRWAPSTQIGPADGIGQGRGAVETRPTAGNRLVVLGLEIAIARVECLDLERLAGLDSQQRFVSPVKGKLARPGLAEWFSWYHSPVQIEREPSLLMPPQKSQEIAELLHGHQTGQVFGHDRILLRLALPDVPGLDDDQLPCASANTSNLLRATVRAGCR